MSPKDWQSKLDSYFPDGVMVTRVTDVPEGNDNTILVCPRMLVLGVKDDMPAMTSPAINISSPKDVNIYVNQIDVDKPGLLDVVDVDGTQWILSGTMPPAAATLVKSFTDPGILSYQPGDE